ncbi:hypothetical protein GI374_16955 [Paracoccus sp. S-4012]|uniref:hypothetical protein n=1 Tax=Paracoccus sp. S-4012 TaxID=2665648 RepID=UPI0012B11F42|nr:hypothetical protein [Paracoccus sp. S-4012]
MGQQRRNAGGARALGHHLRLFGEAGNRVLDLVLGDARDADGVLGLFEQLGMEAGRAAHAAPGKQQEWLTSRRSRPAMALKSTDQL